MLPKRQSRVLIQEYWEEELEWVVETNDYYGNDDEWDENSPQDDGGQEIQVSGNGRSVCNDIS